MCDLFFFSRRISALGKWGRTQMGSDGLNRILSCTRLRVPPVALHVSQLISWIFIAFCRCSTGVALHPLKILVSHLPPPPVPGGVAPKFGSEKVSRYTGVSQLQLRVSRYTVQLRLNRILTGYYFFFAFLGCTLYL